MTLYVYYRKLESKRKFLCGSSQRKTTCKMRKVGLKSDVTRCHTIRQDAVRPRSLNPTGLRWTLRAHHHECTCCFLPPVAFGNFCLNQTLRSVSSSKDCRFNIIYYFIFLTECSSLRRDFQANTSKCVGHRDSSSRSSSSHPEAITSRMYSYTTNKTWTC